MPALSAVAALVCNMLIVLSLPRIAMIFNCAVPLLNYQASCRGTMKLQHCVALLFVHRPVNVCGACASLLSLQYLADAVREFTGTREEVRVMVADCEAAIASGDVAGALQRLRRVPESSMHYTRARVAMAEIYLKHRQDRAAFVECYLDLVVSTAVVRCQPEWITESCDMPATCPAVLCKLSALI